MLHLRLEWVFSLFSLCIFFGRQLALTSVSLTDEHSPCGQADSASSHLIWGGVMFQFAQEMFRQHLSSGRTALLQLRLK